MVEQVSVDRQGRLVLPVHFRRAMGLEEGGTVSLRLSGRKVTIEAGAKLSDDSIKRVRDIVLSNRAQMMTAESEEASRWMTPEYARRKLGLS